MRRHKVKQAFVWELHDAWAFPFAELLLIGFLAQTLSVTFISYGATGVEESLLAGGVGIMRFAIFLRTEYPIIIFCTLMPAKVFGECVEKRKIHIPLMAGVSRGELFMSKLMVTMLPIWVVQLGSLTAAAILNHMFDFPYPASIWVSTLIGVLALSLFVSSFSILLSILLRKFSLAALLGIGLFAILDYWALQTPFENIVGYVAPVKSAMVLEEALHRLLAQTMAGAHVYPSYPPQVYNFSIPYLLFFPFLFMLLAALVFRVIDLD